MSGSSSKTIHQTVLVGGAQTVVDLSSCNLTGKLVLLGFEAATEFTVYSNDLTEVYVSGWTLLEDGVYLGSNPRLSVFSGAVPLLAYVDASGCNFASIPSSLRTGTMVSIDMSDNPNFVSAGDLSGCAALTTLDLSGCALPLAVQKAIVADLATAGNAAGDVLDMSGGTSETADAALIAAAADLVNVTGWNTVNLNL